MKVMIGDSDDDDGCGGNDYDENYDNDNAHVM